MHGYFADNRHWFGSLLGIAHMLARRCKSVLRVHIPLDVLVMYPMHHSLPTHLSFLVSITKVPTSRLADPSRRFFDTGKQYRQILSPMVVLKVWRILFQVRSSSTDYLFNSRFSSNSIPWHSFDKIILKASPKPNDQAMTAVLKLLRPVNDIQWYPP